MKEKDIVGKIYFGKKGDIRIRQKMEPDAALEIGELLVAENANEKVILQVYDLIYGSQHSESLLALISGMHIEGIKNVKIIGEKLRNYIIAVARSLVRIDANGNVSVPKRLPRHFSDVRRAEASDFAFLRVPATKAAYFGNIRSGSKVLNVPIYLDAVKVFSHHIMIAATTGRGKSNLLKVILWSVVDNHNTGVLVLDPHDEYYGRNQCGLKDHPAATQDVVYYSLYPPRGGVTLMINVATITPIHLKDALTLTEAQYEALLAYYSTGNPQWIEDIIKDAHTIPPPGQRLARFPHVSPSTLAALSRKLEVYLGISYNPTTHTVQYNNPLFCPPPGPTTQSPAGLRTIQNIVNYLEQGKKVIIDTSQLSRKEELLLSSMVAHEVLSRYKRYKRQGVLKEMPVISIVIEEARSVLGEEVLKGGDNIFSIIAREGRKFKVGLIAITQLPSQIPRDILANINTKIILGLEQREEREAIIESAHHDLSYDSEVIASLDIGEGIISSIFSEFPIPIKIPLFGDYCKKHMAAITQSGPDDDSEIVFTG